jgi:hypothetical protein
MTHSYQFKTTLDVLRNILLDVPKPHQRHQSGAQIDTSTKSSGSISSVAAMEMKQILIGDVKYRDKKGRQMLRSAAMSLLREVEDRIALEGSEVFRRISYTLGKLQWSMQSQDTIEDVQISLTRFHGQHDYSRNGSTVSQFSLEDLRLVQWVDFNREHFLLTFLCPLHSTKSTVFLLQSPALTRLCSWIQQVC